ncbi:glutathione synthetase-like isoform X2 [Anopheles aquasalis]|uniref:glutathione synthetase-like isoform X2 n=1 Tax=Anopheles aquasalis TaxID=42839 RepID=UPI00215A1EA8|nr:glutathione synthetase-like isoform X2 [Anopheles aquasalis]
MASSSTPTLKSCIPLPLDEAQLIDVVEKAKDWALMHGAAMRSKHNFNPDALQFAPFILTPSSFPRAEFQKAVRLQPVLNELIHAVAHDSEFLLETLKSTEKVDEFTGRLVEIYRTVLSEGIAQTLTLALLRSDYLPNFSDAIKQVEINTIASSFGGISTNITPMHSYILTELGHQDKLENLPENRALSGLCDAMVEAWKLQNRPTAAILFVVEDRTYNICDQRFHEFYIRETYPHVPVVRCTLTQLASARLGPGRKLLLPDRLLGGREASVVYYRAGYEPGHYHGPQEWAARLLIERSVAIKCPSIQYHLAGTKKVQQALAKPEVLRRFVGSDEAKIEAICDIFTGLYSLDRDEEGDEAVRLALQDPERYVLKPQREGGGNNVYGADIPAALAAMSGEERSAWILMERIFPPLSTGYMIRPDAGTAPPVPVQLVSELGIFGAIIGSKEKILYNKQVGHMLRTKLSTANEGGVAAGLGALDSPYLID